MTDVPGYTRGIVPGRGGIRFLHLAVNTASPLPQVPDISRWRAPDGADAGLGFAHTQDNTGPQSVSQAAEAYRDMRRLEPDAIIRAATLRIPHAFLQRLAGFCSRDPLQPAQQQVGNELPMWWKGDFSAGFRINLE